MKSQCKSLIQDLYKVYVLGNGAVLELTAAPWFLSSPDLATSGFALLPAFPAPLNRCPTLFDSPLKKLFLSFPDLPFGRNSGLRSENSGRDWPELEPSRVIHEHVMVELKSVLE